MAEAKSKTAKTKSSTERREVADDPTVVPLENLIPTAENWANETMKGAPLSIRASKEATIKGLNLPLEEAIPKVFPGMAKMHNSEDYIEGPKAFAEKRPPQWKGR